MTARILVVMVMLIAGVWVSECCSKKNVVVTLMMQYIAERRSAEQDVASVMLMTQYTADRRSAEQDAASVMLMTQYTAGRRSAELDAASVNLNAYNVRIIAAHFTHFTFIMNSVCCLNLKKWLLLSSACVTGKCIALFT
jgi:hypothetical protein